MIIRCTIYILSSLRGKVVEGGRWLEYRQPAFAQECGRPAGAQECGLPSSAQGCGLPAGAREYGFVGWYVAM